MYLENITKQYNAVNTRYNINTIDRIERAIMEQAGKNLNKALSMVMQNKTNINISFGF